MPDKKFDLGDYVEVKDRIKLFYELYGKGALVTSGYELTAQPDDKPKVIVTALAYRTPEDPHPGVGTSWMYLPGSTSYTKGSEIENAETSAWGRAIGALGILIDRSIATSTEIEAKSGETARHADKPDPARAAVRADEPELIGPYAATGALGINPKPPADGFMRQEPDGAIVVVTFTDTDNHKIPQVMVRGALAADLLDAAGADIKGLLCNVEGDLYRVPWFKENKPMPPFQRLELARISTSAWSLPVPVQTGPGLFDEADERELDAALT